MHTLRDGSENIVTWQSADGAIGDVGALTASIAHEVSQPLSGIVNNANVCLLMLAANPPDVEAARAAARRAIREGRRAADVLDAMRALFSRRDLTLEVIDLNDVTREVIALAWHDLQQQAIVVRTELGSGLPGIVGDRIQLQQVVLNLLRNACDAMRGVTDRPRQLLVSTSGAVENSVCVTVRDVGVGLDPQGIDHLFDPFYTTKRTGMGIGLSLCRSIIERHHGRLWAEANEGPGATFSFSIPGRVTGFGNGRLA
jgi:signal transduction histidine kinase